MNGPAMTTLSSPVVRCAQCQRDWPVEAWRALPTVTTLSHADVRGYVSAWPDGAVVEVRTCGECGHAIARACRSRAPR